MEDIIVTTTDNLDGYKIQTYIGLVVGEVVLGMGFVRDWLASVKDKLGGRVHGFEDALKDAERDAVFKMVERAKNTGANAVIGIRFNHEVLSPGGTGTELVIIVNGTAVYAVRDIDATTQ